MEKRRGGLENTPASAVTGVRASQNATAGRRKGRLFRAEEKFDIVATEDVPDIA